ncbi:MULTISPECIES: hypothetical protein [unclassified Cyanobium]|uniref:hypothetical protein n=1 Tax=unclassified Cyanobium TaxID=2627006 RepID=UPI0020CE039E|nr:MULTISPECIES: hypothetical protein [unclassified Cyanobium]MCP9860092.1 hypothetical protein [Cyanobium sp. Cruz-8H5]MCP9867314.1 hypothetical protein [Cyanobium sp. Cruz-8D1]
MPDSLRGEQLPRRGVDRHPNVIILDLAHVTECPMESSDLLDRQLCSLGDDGVEILLSRAGRLLLVSRSDWAITDRIDAYEHLDSARVAAEWPLLSWYEPRPLRAPPPRCGR